MTLAYVEGERGLIWVRRSIEVDRMCGIEVSVVAGSLIRLLSRLSRAPLSARVSDNEVIINLLRVR